MIRAVLDTNVVVSALLFRGAASEMHRAWRSGRLAPLVCPELLSEYVRVLAYPRFGLAEPTVWALLYAELLPFCEFAQPVARHAPDLPRCRDPDDRKVLECAWHTAADWLVTGDEDLLSLAAEVPWARILGLREALSLLSSQ